MYLLQLGFLPVAVVGRLVQDLYKIGKRQHKGRNNIQNNTQNRKQKTNMRHLTVTCVSNPERLRICVALHLRLT